MGGARRRMGCGGSTQPKDACEDPQLVGSLAEVRWDMNFLARYAPIKKLGSGGCATVYEVKDKSDETRWAAKVIQKSQAGQPKTPPKSKDRKKSVPAVSQALIQLEEAATLKVQGHENIIKFREIIDTAKTSYMVFECLDGPDLFDQIEHGPAYSEQMAADAICALMSAMQHVHSHGIVHRDMKPENVRLRSNEGPLVVLDFGLALPISVFKTRKGAPIGTPNFMAPEMISKLSVNEKVDVWAVGVMAYTMLCGQLPFEDTQQNYDKGNFEPLFALIKSGDVKFDLPCWGLIPASAIDMIKAMLTVGASNRPSFETLLEHEWLKITCTKFNGKRGDSQKVVLTGTQERFVELNENKRKLLKRMANSFCAVRRMTSTKSLVESINVVQGKHDEIAEAGVVAAPAAEEAAPAAGEAAHDAPQSVVIGPMEVRDTSKSGEFQAALLAVRDGAISEGRASEYDVYVTTDAGVVCNVTSADTTKEEGPFFLREIYPTKAAQDEHGKDSGALNAFRAVKGALADFKNPERAVDVPPATVTEGKVVSEEEFLAGVNKA